MEDLDPADTCLAGRDAWFDALDAAFGKTTDELKYPTSNENLLGLAYRIGGESVYGNPGASFSEYLAAGRSAALLDFSGSMVPWKRGMKAEDLQFPDIPDSYGQGKRKPRPKRASKRGGNPSRPDWTDSSTSMNSPSIRMK